MLQHEFLSKGILIPHFGLEKDLIGVEIGVLGGVGSYSLLLYIPRLTLYSIDPWETLEGNSAELNQTEETLKENYRETKFRLDPFGKRSIIIKKTSDEAVKDIPEGVDFVHIDGCHEPDQVIKDMNNYFPKIRTGGILSGHDYGVPGVAQALGEVFKDSVIFTGDDTTWWIYK